MNPKLKKSYLLNAFDYNSQLNDPLFIYYNQEDKYIRLSKTERNDISLLSKQQYYEIIEKDYNAIIEHRKKSIILQLCGNKSSWISYFTFYFNQHPHQHLELLKNFNFFTSNSKEFDFLHNLSKETLTPLLEDASSWLLLIDNFSIINNLQQLMLDKQFIREERQSIIQNFIIGYHKFIAKKAHLCSKIEDFIKQDYPELFSFVIEYLEPIKKRNEPIDFSSYQQAFQKNDKRIIGTKLNISTIRNTFHIQYWDKFDYSTIVNLYHSYLTEYKQYDPKTYYSKEQTDIDIYITIPNTLSDSYSEQHYIHELFDILSFCRQQKFSSNELTTQHINTLLCHAALNNSLIYTSELKSQHKI